LTLKIQKLFSLFLYDCHKSSLKNLGFDNNPKALLQNL